MLADLPGEHTEVTGIDTDATELGPGDLDRVGDALRDVVRVHQQGGADTEFGDLGRKGGLLVGSVRGGVHQGERVGAGAGARYTVTVGGLEVRRGGETGQVRGSRCGDGRLLVGTS